MQSLTRRAFLRITALSTASTLAAACTSPGEESPAVPVGVAPTSAPSAATPAAPSGGTARFAEAPVLAEMVGTGALPPVEERLPSEPKIVPVVEEIGQYGGTWHRCAVGASDPGVMYNRVGGESLVRWKADASAVLPNVASAIEVNEDATQFTVRLRPGMKWSDGAPFTADDFVFWYEDVILNTDLSPTPPRWFRDPVSDEVGVVEKVDDQTFRITFASTYGVFVDMLGLNSFDMCLYPKHYLTQFHPTYADSAELDAKVKAANFTNWWELFGNKRAWQNPEMPRLLTWLPVRVPPDIPIVCERNPYYYKVDPEGNQLPYIDDVHFDVVENSDLLNLKAVAGEIDMQLRHIVWTNYPLFVENAEKGGYRVIRWALAEGSNCTLYLNHNHKDPVMRQLIEARDFRIALSLGIDRTAINELAYQGLGVPRQAALIPESPYFKEEHAALYAEHDPDRANAILDDLGLADKDSEGFRLRPDGEPLSITIEYAPVFGPWRDTVTMICDQWQSIGIRGIAKEEDRTLLTQRGTANERDCGVWVMDRCATPWIEPYWWQPTAGGYAWGELYGQWYSSGGVEGEEPPEEIKAQYALYDRIRNSTPADIPALAEEYFQRFSENVWVIGTVGALPAVGIVKNNFRNVPERAVSDWLQLTPNNTDEEQYFVKA